MAFIWSSSYIHHTFTQELLSGRGGTSVDGDGVVLGDFLDQVLLGEESESAASERDLDAKTLRDNSRGDELP